MLSGCLKEDLYFSNYMVLSLNEFQLMNIHNILLHSLKQCVHKNEVCHL